jgi:hypothetical protein
MLTKCYHLRLRVHLDLIAVGPSDRAGLPWGGSTVSPGDLPRGKVRTILKQAGRSREGFPNYL